MLAFDHIVVASENPLDDRRQLTEKYNLTGVPGGHHENWGTFNELSYFSNRNYIEWLGLQHPDTASQSDNPLIQQFKQTFDQGNMGPFQFALRTTDMDGYISYFRSQNIAYTGPFPGERMRPDGSVLKWRMLFPKGPAGLPPLPFLIEWEGVNEPSQASDINAEKFQSLSIGTEEIERYKEVLVHTFQLKNMEEPSQLTYRWPLQNGELILTKGQHIFVHFDTFQL
ncbi:VOC family protein [Halobacillus sp. A1]|uniref:VOC family protein n=1 Tax=Halobacillus sp. A1 TaxID=2880262 RepID=UPI0020A68A1A|nr:VOC family protein [Halobacillus sp. A1]MCP3029760.1 VOC family protein [Halobacillus sp. A1]